MRQWALLLIALAWFVQCSIACRLVEMGPEGDKAREQGATTIRTLLPAPWGELAAAAFTSVTGGIALVKNNQAKKNKKEAKKNKDLATVAVKVIEEAKNPALKQRAKQLSTIYKIPTELDALVHEVIPHTDPPKLPEPPRT